MDKAQNGSLIHLENLTKVFLTDEVETHALAGVHLDIQKGEYVAISGPSGCGKTTLLSILGLLDSPSGGAYRLNGQPVESLKPSQRARVRNREIGFVFQSFNLIGDLTVYENVELPLTYRGMGAPSASAAWPSRWRRWAWHIAPSTTPASSRAVSSSAWPWRARWSGKPSILLADEPTGNLDSKNGEAVMELLGELHRSGATICMVTHDSRYARHADRTVHLFDGRVVDERATPRSLRCRRKGEPGEPTARADTTLLPETRSR